MRAIVTSIGEATTNLCVWSLERNGFEVELMQNESPLALKLQDIYNKYNEPFLRVDADVIVNRNMTPELCEKLLADPIVWWWQFIVFDWYKLDVGHQMALISTNALDDLRANIGQFITNIRPETSVSRIEAFYNPRRMETYPEQIMGIHGFGIKDMKPVVRIKSMRNQLANYDFELAQRLNEL